MQDQTPQAARPGISPAATPQHEDTSLQHSQAEPSRYDSYYRSGQPGRAEQLAKALGWFSIGLGLAQLIAPRRMSRFIGMHERPGMMRMLGARELASGVGILSQPRPANWMWTRVAGDAMDLALLGNAARSPHARRRRIALAAAAVAGVAALDMVSGIENNRRKKMGQGVTTSGEVYVEKSITINRPAEECYRFWRDFEHFPRFMRHVESVQTVDDNRLHWKVRGPAGTHIEWDAEVTSDEPNRYLAWRSLAHADVDNSGAVYFEPASSGRGTTVRVILSYRPPAGAAGALVAKMFGREPAQQIDEDLRRFKWLIETGEIPTTVGQPSGERGMMNRLLFRKGEPG